MTEFDAGHFDAQKIIDEHDGKCKTRDGRDAVIYAVCPDQECPILGAVDMKVRMAPACWHRSGNRFATITNDLDLIMPRTLVAEWWTGLWDGRPTSGNYDTVGELRELRSIDRKVIRSRLYSDNTVESEVVE